MVERTIEFESGNYMLVGTLTMPTEGKRLPVVLMLPGSGQTDRNDNAKILAINVFPQMVEAVGDLGFASLRYDKRGVGASAGDYWRTGFADRVTDAEAAVKWLRSQSGIDPERIYVLGHSEGALLAISLAAGSAGIAGAILLAGSSKTGEETLLWQGQKITGSLTGFSKWLIDFLHIDPLKKQRQSINKIKSSTKATFRAQLFQKVNARWMREFLAYDPENDLSRIKVPVLAITGSKDIQVDPADLERMKQLVKGPFEAHEVADVTHLLRVDGGVPSLKTYRKQVRQPVDERVINYIKVWLKGSISGDINQAKR